MTYQKKKMIYSTIIYLIIGSIINHGAAYNIIVLDPSCVSSFVWF